MSRSNGAHNLVVKHLKIHHAQRPSGILKYFFFLESYNFFKTRLLEVSCEAKEVEVGWRPTPLNCPLGS